MNLEFKNYLLKATNSSDCEEIEVIQSLWSGYGKISRYQLDNGTVVIKCISLNQASAHPRGWNTDNSYQRKVKSYQVETHWYENWNQLCSDDCKVPNFIGSFSQGKDQWIILEDLDVHFPIRKYELSISEVKVCLKWLANFHAIFLSKKPKGLWEVGTYWHLKTRPDELEKMNHPELKSKAHLIDDILNQCKFRTVIHGDAKLANFCFSENGEEVAAVDFQYVGGGCGMKDVAYFLGSCLSGSECELHEKELLNFYFLELSIVAKLYNIKELEQEWRKLYPISCTDFTRFLLGWMPSHQKLNGYSLDKINSVLKSV